MITFTDEQLAAVATAVEHALDRAYSGTYRALAEALDLIVVEANARCVNIPRDDTGNSLHVARLARVAR